MVFPYGIFKTKRAFIENTSLKMTACVRDYISNELISLGLRKVFIRPETYFEPST
jgi:hypothetical protein